MGFLVPLMIVVCIRFCQCELERDWIFLRRESAKIEPYRKVTDTSTLSLTEKGLGCVQDERCLSFDTSSKNGTNYFTTYVDHGGAYYLQTRCPMVENMRYSRPMDLCYRLVEVWTGWHCANKACREHGGRLISLDTDEKYNYIAQEFEGLKASVWLGAFWTGTRWEWLNGHELLQSNPHWLSDEPSNVTQDFVALPPAWFGQFGFFGDKNSSFTHFICEY